MAKRFTDTDLWDKEWFMALSPKHKCLIRFLYDKCDAAGVWSANWMLASAYIGETVTEEDLSIFDGRVVKISAGKFFIIEFIEFQYGTLSENCKPHQKILSLLKKYQIEFNEIKGYLYPMYRVKEKEEEKDKDMEEDEGGMGETEKPGCPPNQIEATPGGRTEEVTPNNPELFEKFWDMYGKKVGKADTIRQWNRLTLADITEIMEKTPAYVASKTDKQFRKDPERYLKKKTWRDEIVIPGAVKAIEPPSKTEALLDTYAEVRRIREEQRRQSA